MKVTEISNVFKEENIIVFSPHYDDFALMMGGYFEELKQKNLLNTKKVTSILIFGRSNYIKSWGDNNFDVSLDRIKYVTGHRFLEDTEALNEIVGRYNYTYINLLEDEALVRGRTLAENEMEFIHSAYENLSGNEKAIMSRIEVVISKYAVHENTALIFPIAVKGHVDHFIIREAAINAFKRLGKFVKAGFYFQEGKPYLGVASEEEKAVVFNFVRENKLEPITYKHHPEKCIEIFFKHYLTQCDKIYKTGMRNRANELRKETGALYPCDRAYRL